MAIETFEDILEEIANDLGVYGSHSENHPDEQCECRTCWMMGIKPRMLEALRIEALIYPAAKPTGEGE